MMVRVVCIVSLFFLYSIKVETAQLECSPQDIRLIKPSDVEVSYVEDGISDFASLLSVSPIFGKGYFASTSLPNEGNLIFSQTFLIVGFTTLGYDVYVSEFSFQYSDSLDNPYQTYSQTFQVNSADETSFFFEEPLLARRIQLTISDAVTGDSGIYYWKMNLFGCPEVNAPTIISTTTSSVTTSTITTTCTVTTSRVTTNPVTTSIVMEAPVQSTDQKSDNCQKELITPVVLLVFIILMIAVLIVTVLMVYFTRKRKRFDLKSKRSIHNRNTLEFPSELFHTENQIQINPPNSTYVPQEIIYTDIDEVNENYEIVEVNGGYQVVVEDNPAYVESTGGFQIENNPAYVEITEVKDGNQMEDNPTYMCRVFEETIDMI